MVSPNTDLTLSQIIHTPRFRLKWARMLISSEIMLQIPQMALVVGETFFTQLSNSKCSLCSLSPALLFRRNSRTSQSTYNAQFFFQHHLKPPSPFYQPLESFSELQDSLSCSLEELSEGIDVLHILECAYDSTVKAHLAPPTPLHTGSFTALLAALDHPPSTNSNNIPLPQSPGPPFRN